MLQFPISEVLFIGGVEGAPLQEENRATIKSFSPNTLVLITQKEIYVTGMLHVSTEFITPMMETLTVNEVREILKTWP